MKLAMTLTLDGLMRSLTALARTMADERDRGYAGDGNHAGRAGAITEREPARTDRNDLRRD